MKSEKYLLLKKMRRASGRLSHWFNHLNVNPQKWPNTLKDFVGSLPTNCLSVLDYFVGLVLKRLKYGKGYNCILQ